MAPEETVTALHIPVTVLCQRPIVYQRITRGTGKDMHKLLTDSPGNEMYLLGNEAIARGAIEAGVAVATCYPGTPSSEIPDSLFAMQKEQS